MQSQAREVREGPRDRNTASPSNVRSSGSREVSPSLTSTRFPGVAVADVGLLNRFLEYATEEVTYHAEGTPSSAMSFNALGHFFDDAELITTLTDEDQRKLIDEIRPPPGRFVTWKDFVTVLQIVADAVYPELEDEALALALVMRGALDRLDAMDLAAARRGPSAATVPPATSPGGEDAAHSGARSGDAATTRSKSSKPSKGPVGYRPRGLSRIAEKLSTFIKLARSVAVRSASIVLSHAALVDAVGAALVDALLPCAPQPATVKALRITFETPDKTALQLLSALRPVLLEPALAVGSAGREPTVDAVDEQGLWEAVAAAGAVLFPSSPKVAQEELALQVFIEALKG